MKKLFCLMGFSAVLLIGCVDNKIEYFSRLSVKNESSSVIANICIDTWIYDVDDYEKRSYTYRDLFIGEQSEYQNVVTGVSVLYNITTERYIKILIIYYTINSVPQSVTVFDDGLVSTYYYYEILSEEDLEKVYLKKDTYNTLVITDDGVELIQGE